MWYVDCLPLYPQLSVNANRISCSRVNNSFVRTDTLGKFCVLSVFPKKACELQTWTDRRDYSNKKWREQWVDKVLAEHQLRLMLVFDNIGGFAASTAALNRCWVCPISANVFTTCNVWLFARRPQKSMTWFQLFSTLFLCFCYLSQAFLFFHSFSF